MRGLESAIAAVEKASTAVAAVIIMALTFLVVIDVVGRKLFAAPLSGTTDIAELTLAALVFLTIASVQRGKGHIRIELLLQGASTKTQRVFELLNFVLGLAITAPVTWYTGNFAWKSLIERDYTAGIVRVPIWPAKLIAVFGLAMLCLQLTLDIVCATSQMRFQQTTDGETSEESGS